MKKALTLVADGVPYRDASKEVGYRDHREVYRWSKRAGLLGVHTGQLVAAYRRIAQLSNSELERRLIEEPETIMTRDLTVISGVAADKIAKLERSDLEEEGNLARALLVSLQATNTALEIRVEPSPPRDEGSYVASPTGGEIEGDPLLPALTRTRLRTGEA